VFIFFAVFLPANSTSDKPTSFNDVSLNIKKGNILLPETGDRGRFFILYPVTAEEKPSDWNGS